MAGMGVPATPVRSRITTSFRSDPPAEVPRHVEVGRTDRVTPVVLEIRARRRIAAAGLAVALDALEGVEHFLAPAEGRVGGRHLLGDRHGLELGVLVALGERLDVGHDGPALLVRERSPGGHRGARHPLRHDPEQVLVGRERAGHGANLVLPGREVPRARHEELRRGAVPLAAGAVAARAALLVDLLPEREVAGLGGRRTADRGRRRSPPGVATRGPDPPAAPRATP